MPIYRGDGGSGDATTDAYASQVAQDAQLASEKATQAAASATAAAASASAAAGSESGSAADAAAAAASAAAAATSETNAASSETAASTSETNAATSATNAATSETNAATSATTATTQASAASTSATNAANSATVAAASETNAATSATNAATSETNAATSASQAATSATNAATSASDAATSYDNFDDRYLGEKTSDPSVDNDGDALITGALYFNSTAGQMRVWDGSAWEAAYLPGSSYLLLSGGTMTGALTLNANPSNNLEAATKQYVDDIAAEGIQYHTPVRVEVEGNLTVTYNNGTSGVGATLTNAGTQAALVIDGITMVVNDRVLIYEQTDATQNGIYTVTDIGSASTNWVLTRATDADSYAPSDPDALAQGSGFFVQEGTLGAGEKYVCNTVGTITFGTTNISFVQVATAQIYTAGTGISVNGSVINNTGLLTTGSTATDLAITSADINGGTIDGTTIGGTTAAAGTFTTLKAESSSDNLLTLNSTDDGGVYIEFERSNDRHAYVGFGGTNDVFKVLNEESAGEIQLGTASTTAITIDSSQNVGIGETSPSTLLHIKGIDVQQTIESTAPTSGSTVYKNASTTNGFYVGLRGNLTGDGLIYHGDANNIEFWTNGTQHMVLNSGGSLGIGTALPAGGTKLQVNGLSRVTDGTTNIDAVSASGVGYFGTQTNHPLSLRTNDVVRATINADGTVDFTSDVFTTADIVAGKGSGAIALTINDGYGNSNIAFNHQDGTPDQNGNAARIEVNTDQTSGAYMHFEGLSNVTGGTAVTLNDMARMYADSGDFHANGNVIAYSTSISDVRLKENVEQVTGALDMLDQIRGVTFDRTDTGKKSAGVIAQELEQVMPYAIYETALPLKTGSEDDVYKLVEYDALHAVLIEAIKELRAEVEELRASSN